MNENVFSLLYWVYTRDHTFRWHFCKDSGVEPIRDWYVGQGQVNACRIGIWQTNTTFFSAISPDNTLIPGRWTHITFQVNSNASTITLRFNGSAEFDVTPDGWDGTIRNSADNPLRITRFGAYPHNGQVSDPLVFNRLLDESEILWLVNPTNRLRVPWRRTIFEIGSMPKPIFQPAWAQGLNTHIGV